MSSIDEQIDEYEARVYGKGEMSAHSRSVLRQMLEAEDKFWSKEAVRVDNHNSHDDY